MRANRPGQMEIGNNGNRETKNQRQRNPARRFILGAVSARMRERRVLRWHYHRP